MLHRFGASKGAQHVVMKRVIGHAMPLRNDVFGQLRIPDDPVARHEERRGSPIFFQQPQQFGCGQRIGAVIEG